MAITVSLLIEMLKVEDPDKELYFGGLDFFRLKDRGEVVQVEFNQTVYEDGENVVVVNHKFE
jgi:hypothetical protein